jgi:hypothetical protein
MANQPPPSTTAIIGPQYCAPGTNHDVFLIKILSYRYVIYFILCESNYRYVILYYANQTDSY